MMTDCNRNGVVHIPPPRTDIVRFTLLLAHQREGLTGRLQLKAGDTCSEVYTCAGLGALSGCSAKFLALPPTSALAPRPTPTAADADAPT